jgi:hypothetical protein
MTVSFTGGLIVGNPWLPNYLVDRIKGRSQGIANANVKAPPAPSTAVEYLNLMNPGPVQRRHHRPQRGDQGHQRRLALGVWRLAFGVRRSAFNDWPFAGSSSPRVKFLKKLNSFRS